MKYIFYLLTGIIICPSCNYFKRLSEPIPDQVAVVYGWVKEGEYQKPLAKAQVEIKNQKTLTDEKGYFILNNVPIGPQTIKVSKEGYLTQTKLVKVVKDEVNKIEPIYLERKKTKVGGILAENCYWTQDKSPYVVTGRLLVKGNLEISAGVLVEVFENVRIKVEGKLILNGSPGEEIKITSYQLIKNKGDWDGIFVEEGGEIKASHAIIEYAEEGFFIFRAKKAEIINCVIRENLIAGLEITQTLFTLKNCQIYNNGTHGLHYKSWTGQYSLIEGNEFFNNGHSGIFVQSAKSKIVKNTLRNNVNNGLWYQHFQPIEKGIIRQCNFIENGQYAVRGNGSNEPPLDLEVVQCYIKDNYFQHFVVKKESNSFLETQCEEKIWVKEPSSEMIEIR
jgi:parallel beta-helix repeat protein